MPKFPGCTNDRDHTIAEIVTNGHPVDAEPVGHPGQEFLNRRPEGFIGRCRDIFGPPLANCQISMRFGGYLKTGEEAFDTQVDVRWVDQDVLGPAKGAYGVGKPVDIG